ncbi:MAG: YrhB domain-containing protein [Bacteroidota bacterium]
MKNLSTVMLYLIALNIALPMVTKAQTISNQTSKNKEVDSVKKTLTKEQAEKVAYARLKQDRNVDWVILDKETDETPTGWIFYYTTRKMAETGNPSFGVPGNLPLLVDKSTGSVSHVPNPYQ